MANNDRAPGLEGDGDDDFEDFGGFEAADPVPDMPAAQAQAAASPWVMFNAGNAPDRPDLLCAQNRFPNCLDPSPADIASGGSGPINANLNINNVAGGAAPDLPPADLLGGQARISADEILDGALNPGPGGAGFHSNAINGGRLPDLGLGNNEEHLFHGQAGGLELGGPSVFDRLEVRADPSPSLPVQSLNNVVDIGAEQLPSLSRPDLPASRPLEHSRDANVAPRGGAEAGPSFSASVIAVTDSNSNATTGGGRNADDAVGGISQGVARLQDDAAQQQRSAAGSLADREFQQQLITLTEENQRLEEELTQCRSDLATQRSMMEEMEGRHEAAMAEIRQAGHDALAVVVEQYKEQVKVVTLEQQEETKRQVAEAIREQMRVFQDMLQTQKEQQDEQRKEDKEELERQIKQAVENSRHDQQEQFQTFLSEEREKLKESAEKSLEAERQASEVRLQEFMTAETERGKARLEEVRAEASKKLEEERRNHEAALTTVREEEKRLAKEQMSTLAREERERSRETTQAAVEASRLESRAYLQEQRQADSRVRQRHLASLDLFLESSRQQIALLIDSERPEATTSSTAAVRQQPQPSASSSASASSSSSSKSPSASPPESGGPQLNGS